MTTQLDAAGFAVAAVLGVIIWLPAMWVAGKRMNWTIPGVLGAAFSLAFVATGVAAIIAWLFGASLSLVIALIAVEAVALLLLAWRFRRGGAVRPGLWGVTVGLLVGGLAFYERPWFGFTADTFYHLAAARSLIVANAPLVTDPLHATGATGLDPTSGVFHTWLAVASRLSGGGVEYIYTGFAALAAAAVAMAFWALAERVSGSSGVATVASLGFAAFGLWADFRMAGMPNRFAVALLCVALLALLESTRRDRRLAAGLVAAIAGAAALLTHLAAAGALLVFALAALTVVLLFARRLREAPSGVPRLTPLLLAPLIALPAVVSRALAVLASPMTGTTETLPEAFVSLGAGLLVAKPGKYIGGGPVAFVLMAVIAAWAVYRGYRERDGVALTLGAFVAVPVVLLAFPPVTTLAAAVSLYMLSRIVLMMKFIPFLAAAWAGGVGLAGVRSRTERTGSRSWALLLIGLALLAAHAIASWQMTQVTFVRVPDRMRFGEEHTVAESRAQDIRVSWGLSAIWAAEDVFGDDYPVVAASPDTGYYLAGLTDVAIVAAPDSHTPLATSVTDAPLRRQDMERLLEPDTSVDERSEILDRWNASYVALSLAEDVEIAAWESMRTQTALFEPVVDTRRLVILRVLR
jgi:hypothetical protein